MEYQPPEPLPGATGSERTSLNMDPKLEAALCYLCCWLTGLIIFLLEKENNFVRFHALQSLITFGAFTALSIGWKIITWVPGFGIFWFFFPILWICEVVAWIILIVKAYQGERFHFPITGDIAERNLT